MFGGIQVFDMIKRHKENEKLGKNINYFKTKGTYTRTSKAFNVDYKTATKEEREEIRKRVILERKKEIIKSIIILIVSILLTGTLVTLLIKFVQP